MKPILCFHASNWRLFKIFIPILMIAKITVSAPLNSRTGKIYYVLATYTVSGNQKQSNIFEVLKEDKKETKILPTNLLPSRILKNQSHTVFLLSISVCYVKCVLKVNNSSPTPRNASTFQFYNRHGKFLNSQIGITADRNFVASFKIFPENLLFLLPLAVVQKGRHQSRGRGYPNMVTNGDIGERGYVQMVTSPQDFFNINIFHISYYFHHILSNLN